jgi:serine/threonine-protein kinase
MDLTSKVLADGSFKERYELLDKLGEGGMGSVHRGVQRALNRPVAIKFMVPDLASEQGYVERFIAEARLAASLIHSNVVAVFDYGVAGSVPYLVTEFVAGRTLSDLLKERPLTVEETVAIGRDVLDGLAAIHKLGIVHRDIKPANIVVVPGSPPSAKILDFGIAKQTTGALLGDSAPKTSTGLVMGTPEFMAPEQAVGDPLTPAADLYAFTLILYRIVVGHPPFCADTVLELLRMQVHAEAPIPDDLLPAVRELLARGLAKKPSERIDTAAAMRVALDRAAVEAFATATFRKPAGGAVVRARQEPHACSTVAATPKASPSAPGRQGQIATSPSLEAAEPTVPSTPSIPAPAAPPPPARRGRRGAFALGAAALFIALALTAQRGGPSDQELWNRDAWDCAFASLPAVRLDPDEMPTLGVKAKNVYRDENRLLDYAHPEHLTLRNPKAIDGDRIQVDVVLTRPNNNLIRSRFSELVEPPGKPGMVHTVWSTSQPLFLMPIGFALDAGSGGAVEVRWLDARPRGLIELDLVGVRSAPSATAVVYRLRLHLDRPGYSLYVSDPERCTVALQDGAGEKRGYAWNDPWRAVGRWDLPKGSLAPYGTARLTVSGDFMVAKLGALENRVRLPEAFALEQGYLYPRLHFYKRTDLVVERMTMSGDVCRNY